ncbi:MAG: FAD-binding oxidoreductase [SAR202 cluster bacterium]|jgi:sarcosine oxidase subunit beta|nr:FAD-binding oxidoreductase [SAR202 cluster bacterium]MDP6713122.1 FAD-binding oxidoreductase [SAR202 cluster bacterium]
MATTASAVVIGGGVVGSSIAHYLAQKGLKDVVLLEKSSIADGATGSSGALVRMHYTDPWNTALALKSLEVFSNWGDLIGGDCGFHKTGFVVVVSKQDSDKLRNNVEMLQGVGVNTDLISLDDLKTLQPQTNIEDVGGAAYEPDSGHADGYSAATALAHRARELGVQVRQGVRVSAIRKDGDKIIGVTTSDGDIDAPIVVLAAGAWSTPLAATVGVDLPVGGQRLTAGAVERPPEFGEPHMVFIDHAVGNYFRPDVGNLTLLGIRPHASASLHVNPDERDEGVALEWQVRSLAQLANRMPAMENAGWRRSWSAVDSYSADGHMILDQSPDVQGLYVATGMSGTGFKTAPAVGMVMAELVLDGKASTVDIQPFRLSRFQENQPIVSENEYEIPPFETPAASGVEIH